MKNPGKKTPTWYVLERSNLGVKDEKLIFYMFKDIKITLQRYIE